MKLSKGALKDLISEEVKKIEKINILKEEKEKILKEIKEIFPNAIQKDYEGSKKNNS